MTEPQTSQSGTAHEEWYAPLERAQRKLMEINAGDGLGHNCAEFMSDDGCEPCWRMAVEITQAFRPASFDLWSTDADEDAASILRGLRKIAGHRFTMALFALAAGHQALDFDAPNAPTENDIDELIQHAEHVLVNLRALKQLSPEVIDDDDDGDDEPEPSPDPAETERA